MDVINNLIKLVGLEYYMSIEQREEFFKSWSHTSILIKPDKENPKDKTALEAFDDDWNKIANVSKQDKHIVWMLLSNSEEKFVKAHVKKIDTENDKFVGDVHKVALSDLHRVAFANGRKRACIMRRKAHEMLQLNDVRSLYIFLYRVAVVVGVSDSLYVATQ